MRKPQGDSQLVQIMDAALAEAARCAGGWLACRPGCTQCCHGAFSLNALDELRLRDGMATLRIQSPYLAAQVEARAQAWIAAHAAGFPGDSETGSLDLSDSGRARFEDFGNDAPCPALNPATGLCDLYLSRPLTCRIFGPPVQIAAPAPDGPTALAHCELCFVGASPEQVAACRMPVPHDLEADLLRELPAGGETVVAYALLPQ